MPESSKEASSLISSDSLPEFEDVEKAYADLIESAKKVELEKKSAGRRKIPEKSSETASASASISVGEEIQFTAEDLEPIIGIPLDAYFIRNGKDKLSDSEKKNLSIATANLFNKYFPSLSKWKEESAFVIALGAIVFTRLEFKIEPEPQPEIKKSDESETAA